MPNYEDLITFEFTSTQVCIRRILKDHLDLSWDIQIGTVHVISKLPIVSTFLDLNSLLFSANKSLTVSFLMINYLL